MKRKKIISLVLAGGMLFSSGSLLSSRAYGATGNNMLIATQKTQKDLKDEALNILDKIEKNPNEKDIKEARKILGQINDVGFESGYTYLLDIYINKNIDKEISPIDELIKAFNKTMEITSYDASSSCGVNLDAKNLSADEKKALEGIIPIINSAKVSADFNVKALNHNQKYKGSGIINVKVMGFDMNIKTWMDVDTLSANPKMKLVFEIPEEAKAFLPDSYKNKKYFVYDLDKIMNNPMFKAQIPSDVNMDFIMKSSNNFGLKIVDRVKDLSKILDAKFDIVSRGDASKIDSKYNISKVYNINLDNDKLMNVVKYTLNDNQMLKIVKSFANDMISLDKISADKKVTDEDIRKGLEEGIKALDKINKAVKFDINAVVGVNKEGYTSYNKGSLKISMDSSKICELFGAVSKDMQKTNSSYTLSLNFDSTLDNINSKKDDVVMPNTNKENSLDYADLLGGMISGVQDAK